MKGHEKRIGDGSGMSQGGVPTLEADELFNGADADPEVTSTPYKAYQDAKGPEMCDEGLDNSRKAPIRGS